MRNAPSRRTLSQPAFVPPVLLRRVPRLPEGDAWMYEVKWRWDHAGSVFARLAWVPAL